MRLRQTHMKAPAYAFAFICVCLSLCVFHYEGSVQYNVDEAVRSSIQWNENNCLALCMVQHSDAMTTIDRSSGRRKQTDRQTDGTVSGHSAAKQTQNCPRNTQRVTDGKLYSRAGNVAINLSKSCTAAGDSEWVGAQTSGPVGHSVMIARCSLFVWR